jgi:hypothetical protein
MVAEEFAGGRQAQGPRLPVDEADARFILALSDLLPQRRPGDVQLGGGPA